MIEVFDFLSYKQYLRKKIASLPKRGRGERSSLARAIQCQTAFVTHVLSGNAHFSLEQAERINPYWSHTEEESHFFLLLVQFERAGTQALKTHFRRSIDRVLQEREDLQKRLKFESRLKLEEQTRYYSAWYYSAIHILVTISRFQTPETIASALQLPELLVKETLEFLVRCRLVKAGDKGYEIGEEVIYLSKDSPLIAKHHANWRLRGLRALEEEKDANLHYSSVFSASKSDMKKIQGILMRKIEEISQIYPPSPAEELRALNLDFFKLDR